MQINKYPNSSDDSEWQCASFGKDTCTIHHSDVKKNDKFYIGITCPKGICNLSLMTMTSDEFMLEDGVEFQAYLTESEARIFKFKIPDQMQDEDHILIRGSAMSGNAHDFTLSVSTTDINDDNELPSSSLEDKKSISAWKKGQVIRLEKEDFPDEKWCKGCELKILMDIVEAGYYRIMVRTTDAVPKIYDGDQIDDIVGFDQVQCYLYYIKSDDTDFQITFSTYTGRIEVKYNPASIPDKWEDFQGHVDQESDMILDIRPWHRARRFQQSKGNYYVCVRGEITSTYTMKVREFQQDWTNSIVEDGYAELFGMRPLSQQIHLYKVPKLEYVEEDIKIEFSLMTRRGPEPQLYAAFCTQNSTEECKQMANKENIQTANSVFKRATSNGQFLRLVIDHDEKKCQDLFNGEECYYVIYIVNPEDNWCRYKLQVSHNQNNHIQLQERTPKVDSVNLHEYKYYKFTIMDQKQFNITNLTFEINPLHGDADIIVARNITFPTKNEYEKKSTRIGSLVDHVSYSIDEVEENSTTSLAGTYYIAVWGYSYATYSIIVIVNRSSQLNNQNNDDRYLRAVNLHQGIPYVKYLWSHKERFYGQFSVSIEENENPSIIFSIYVMEHPVKVLIKYGSMASEGDSDVWFIGTQSYEIKNSSSFYHKNGTYYILILPVTNFLDIFIDKTYSFSITWRTQDQMPHLNSQGIQQVSTKNNEYSYFKHYILDNKQDIRLSLITKGHQDIFVSANPNNTKPNNEASDFTTKYQRGGNYTKGKTLLIPMNLIISKNEACKDLGYAEDNKCVLYIGVQCQDSQGCTSQIELDYDTKQPKRVYSGQSKHTIMSNESFGLYYIAVQQKDTSDVLAVLQTMTGNAYMEYNLQRFSDEFVIYPENNNSISKLNTQTLKIKNSVIQKCFENQTDDFKERIDECQVVIKVIPSKDNKNENLIYNFAAYLDIIEVQNKQAVYGSVSQGEYQYYLYRELCKNCTMLISISGQSNDAVELVINRGTTLPSIKQHDISTPKDVQLLSVNLESTSYFKANKINTMEGNYVIGVFGLKDTTYLLTVTSEDEPIVTIGNGVPIKHSQPSDEKVYFQYYHWSPNDLEITLQVQQGVADLLVSKYQPSQDEFISVLPSSIKNSIWVAENINSTNLVSGKEIVILQDDRDFCIDCYYLIGVRTIASNAMYTLEVKSIDAYKSYQNLLRIGDNKMIKIQANEKKIFQFMLESEDPASIVPTVIKGEVRYYLGFSEEYSKAFYTQSNNNPIKIDEAQPGSIIHPDQNYYLILEAVNGDAELSLNLQQKLTQLTLYDGIPQQVFFHNREDAVKNLQFNMPEGSFTVLLTIKSKTKNFFPQTFVYVDKMDNETNKLQKSPQKFQLPLLWDRDQYISQAARKYVDVTEGSKLNIVLKYNMMKDKLNQNATEDEDDSGSVIVTLTYSQMIKLSNGEEHYGQLSQSTYSFMMFLIDPPLKKITQISFSNCVGLNIIKLLKINQTSSDLKLEDTKTLDLINIAGKQVAQIKDLEGQHYILVESLFTNEVITQSQDIFSKAQQSEFTLKVEYLTQDDLQNKETFITFDGGHINYQPLREKRGDVKFSWTPLFSMKNGIVQNDPLKDVRYKLAYTKNSRINLDSVCAIKRRSDVKFIEIQKGNFDATTSVDLNTDTQFNIIAVIEDKQMVIPYKPVSINMPSRAAHGGRLLVTIVIVVFLAFGFCAIYFFIKNMKLQARLRTELRDVHGTESGVSQTYRRVQDDGNTFSNIDE